MLSEGTIIALSTPNGAGAIGVIRLSGDLAIEKSLIANKAMLTTSIDAGTVETFKKVRGIKGINKVFQNLKKYYSAAKKGIIIKYILTIQTGRIELL